MYVVHVSSHLSVYLQRWGGHIHIRRSFPVLRSCAIISTMHSPSRAFAQITCIVLWKIHDISPMQPHGKTTKSNWQTMPEPPVFGRTDESEESSKSLLNTCSAELEADSSSRRSLAAEHPMGPLHPIVYTTGGAFKCCVVMLAAGCGIHQQLVWVYARRRQIHCNFPLHQENVLLWVRPGGSSYHVPKQRTAVHIHHNNRHRYFSEV